MPVPASNQEFLSSSGERFDKELEVIKLYYLSDDNCKKLLSMIKGEEITKWLDSYGNGEEGWKEFVIKNYLNKSFVINDNIIKYDNSIKQLTILINERSKVMLEAYNILNNE